MTLREKLELAGYRLRALAEHMPTEWQKQMALGWAEAALASAMSAGTAATTKIGAGLQPASATAESRDAQGPSQ